LVFGASIRAGSRRVGNMDVALLAANCRLTIGTPRHRETRTPRRQRWTKISRQGAKTPRIQSS
jgi:hypothetical protein